MNDLEDLLVHDGFIVLVADLGDGNGITHCVVGIE